MRFTPLQDSQAEGGGVPLPFRAGLLGLLLPFAVLFGGVLWLGLAGAALPEAFWPVTLLALFVGLLLSRDQGGYLEAVLQGVSSPLLAIMLMAWFLAGIFGKLLSQTGLVEGLIWLSLQGSVSAPWFPLITFLVASLLSLASGTSIGTLLAVTPILFPVGFSLGADPLLLIGALIGGAYLGDNMAPISDTTIVSAYSQGTEVAKVVQSRLRYALVGLGLTLFTYLALILLSPPPEGSLNDLPEVRPGGLVMLAAPALLVVLMVRRHHLLGALFWSLAFGFSLALWQGLLQPADLLRVNPTTFQVSGVVVEGINSMVGIAIFSIFLMGLVGVLERGGFLVWILRQAERFATTPRRAEVSIVAATLLTNALTTAGTPSMIILGPFVRRLGHHFRIAPWRRGNLLDACSTTLIGFLPYSLSVLIPFSLVGESVIASGLTGFSPVHVVPYVFYCWFLLVTIVFAALSGWGLEFQSQAEFEKEAAELGLPGKQVAGEPGPVGR